MSRRRETLVRGLAKLIAKQASRAFPSTHRDWGEAMRLELNHIDDDGRALRWALGCVAATCRWRLARMQISRWLLCLESLICFGPLTLLWSAGLVNFGSFGGEPKIVISCLAATMAPLALASALYFAASGRRPSRGAMLFFAAGFAALGLVQSFGTTFWFDLQWRGVVLFAALPAFCSWHLSLLEDPASSAHAPA